MATSNEGRKSIKERWEALPHGTRRKAVTLGAGLLVVLFAFMALGTGGKKGVDVHAQDAKARMNNALLPAGDARDIGVNGMSRDVQDLRGRLRQKDQEITQLRGTMNQMRQNQGGGADTANRRMAEELKNLRNDVDRLGQQKPAAPVARTSTGVRAGAPVAGTAPRPAPPRPPSTIREIKADLSIGSGQARSDGPGAPSRPLGSRGNEPAGTTVPTMYLPSGAMLTGVNITGLDAPTGKEAQSNPIPMLVRVKHNAILPNRYRADVRECFILAAGYGDLASERAYLRATSISCVRTDKRVIDIKAEAIAIGPDGKAGIRGRLVSRQGQLIAKAAMAGLAQGVAQAFGNNRTQFGVLQSGQLPTATDVGADAFGGGVGSAFDSIAKYYLKLADAMFPVVEIDPGQRISFVLTKGASMGTLK